MIEQTGRAPLRLRAAHTTSAMVSRAGSVLALPCGEIAGQFRPLENARRRRKAAYELLVSNDTPLPLATFTYAVDGPRPGARRTWEAIVVPPYSAVALAIDVALPKKGRHPRLVAELHSKEAQLSLEAPHSLRPARSIVPRAATFAWGFIVLCVGAATAGHLQPRVIALGAPDSVRAGTPFSVAYALDDARQAEYVVDTPDGQQVRSGTLAAGSGAFTLDLPPSSVSNGYDVRVIAHGPFGADSRTTHVVALPPLATPAPHAPAPQLSAARIVALTLDRDTVHGGEPIAVNYRTAAQAGTVRLIDQFGTVRAEALLNRNGHSILVAPETDVDQDQRIVVSSERGSARDEAAVPIRILAPQPASPAPSGQPNGDTPAVADGSTPIAVVAPADAGSPLVVRVVRHEPALHVALFDASGAQLFASDIANNVPALTLPVPSASSGPLSIVVTFAKGFGQETVVIPVPRRAHEAVTKAVGSP